MIALEAELFAATSEASREAGSDTRESGALGLGDLFGEEFAAALEEQLEGDPREREEPSDEPVPEPFFAETPAEPAAVPPPTLASLAATPERTAQGAEPPPPERLPEQATNGRMPLAAIPTAPPGSEASLASQEGAPEAPRPQIEARRPEIAQPTEPAPDEAAPAPDEAAPTPEAASRDLRAIAAGAQEAAAPRPTAEARPGPARGRERTAEARALDAEPGERVDRSERLDPTHASRAAGAEPAARPADAAATPPPSAQPGQGSNTASLGPRADQVSAPPLPAAPAAPAPAPAPASPPPPPTAMAMAPDAVPLQAEWLAQRGGGRARVELHPPHLGRVDLEVVTRGGEVEIVLAVQESAAHSSMLAQRDPLAEALASRDLRLASFEVTSDEAETSREGFERGDRQHAERDPSAQRESGELRLAVAGPPTPGAGPRASGIDVRI